MTLPLSALTLALSLTCTSAQLEQGRDAREYVVAGVDGRQAQALWNAVFDRGGAVVWTATLYDVDTKAFFMLAFDREALRIYRYGEFVRPYPTRLGYPQLPGPEATRFWNAWSSCIDEDARAEAVIPWRDVREIKAGNWVLYFKLARKVAVRSDRGKKKDLDEIKVNLHGATGTVETSVKVDRERPWRSEVRYVGIGPLAYQERIRHTIVALVDPERRIILPKASRSSGW
jgi:hypothetical protein